MTKKRNIFEEVGTETPRERPVAQPGAIDRAARRGARGAVRLWLMLLFLVVAAMLIIGAFARLTEMLLPMPNWNPLFGALPPLDPADWLAAFERFRGSAAWRGEAHGMGLDEFQLAFWWGWGSRQLAPTALFLWAVGFLFFLAARKMPKGWTLRLLGLGLLILLVGTADWVLGGAGVAPPPFDFLSYRMLLHLGFGFSLLGVTAWFVFKLGRSEAELLQARRAREAGSFRMATALMLLVFLQILLGSQVAGLYAGRTYTDWPMMAGGFFPPDPFYIEPIWRNFFENHGLVQFLHRMNGYLVVLLGLATWLVGRRSVYRRTRRAFDMIAGMALVQAGLGIGTILFAAQWQIAVVHQLGAITLWTLILRARFHAQYPVQHSTIRG
ncbi:COX15/CtaA family protein [Rhodovulum adriaticum]|uniref:Cytochrome c oxidase assembly protein subunit 15 n=1 Tax=Rhodovulum adriaticum TaxID=35804 RepID=A0A4R2NVJ0_RHOAD|nr:COX15/CtaA family protein [Rhodovulum adriaticum]MBK1635641.1 heme A synthase [Rhodovulum adriaticum]TCP26123.1 cytochrome c oxidase assembly protein subunit 15 [Rhodovulum adriaticum]